MGLTISHAIFLNIPIFVYVDREYSIGYYQSQGTLICIWIMLCNMDSWHLSKLNETFVIYVDSPTTPNVGVLWCGRAVIISYYYGRMLEYCFFWCLRGGCKVIISYQAYRRGIPTSSLRVPECSFHVGYQWAVVNVSMALGNL